MRILRCTAEADVWIWQTQQGELVESTRPARPAGAVRLMAYYPAGGFVIDPSAELAERLLASGYWQEEGEPDAEAEK